MSNTQHTADELRRCADELMKSVDKMIDRGQVTKATYDKATQPTILLRAGAKAMDALASTHGAWTIGNRFHETTISGLKDALAKAEARVKVLEEIVQKYVACWDKFMSSDLDQASAYYAFVKGHYDNRDKARAALGEK